MRLGVKAALAGGELVDGDVDIEDGVVARVGVSPAGSEGVAVPGFVDVHINGIAGVDFLTADPDAYRRAGEALARTGVVAYQPTFVSSDESAYGEPLGAAAAAIARGRRRRAAARARRAPRGPVPLAGVAGRA